MERIGELLESTIADLSNSSDRKVINCLNEYPVIMVKSHTRPFERKWLNITAAIIVPAGLFFFFRMWRFRLRLMRDLKKISETNKLISDRLAEMKEEQTAR